ncbi:MAG: ribosome maturation factor RimM [Oscillospiraceae bacterium]|nr:ribosome maturation factor RimM [Oscillospiraceae bacterium]
MKQYLEIIEFTKPQGLNGLIRAKTFCDSPSVLEQFKEFFLGEGKTPLKAELVEVRKGFVILRVDGVCDIEAAQKLSGEILYINRDDYKLPEDTWFISDVIGCQVVDADTGKVYGLVDDVLQNAPKDVYSVRTPSGGQLLFPAIPEVLMSVDITAGRITIRPLEGLFENED